FHSAFIALGLVFRNAHPDEGARYAADGSANTNPGQRGHEWTCRDERTNAWDRQSANSGQPTQTATNNGPGAGASRCAFRSLGIFLVRKILGSFVLGKQHGDVSIAETFLAQDVDGVLHRAAITVDAKNCGVFTCHI